MDIVQDGGYATLFRISTELQHVMPDYVSETTPMTKEAADKLENSEFADDSRRLFPIDSKASTWLAAAYFAKTAMGDNYVEHVDIDDDNIKYSHDMCDYIRNRIEKAAEVYGIQEDVNAVFDTIGVPKFGKFAETKLVYGTDDGAYPLFSIDLVKRACEEFPRRMYKYEPKVRRGIAERIMKQAEVYNVDLPDSIRKEARAGIPRRDTMMAEILYRAGLAKLASRTDMADAMAALANLNEIIEVGFNDFDIDIINKVADTIEDYDRLTGLDKEYGVTVMSPSEFMFDISYKEAEAMAEDAIEIGGTYFSAKKLAELPESVYSDVLGQDFVDRVKTASGQLSVTKLGDELYSLPLPDKNALYSQIKSITD